MRTFWVRKTVRDCVAEFQMHLCVINCVRVQVCVCEVFFFAELLAERFTR